MTLGEEYWQIIPMKSSYGKHYDFSLKNPVQMSKKTKVLLYLLSVGFPYIFNKFIIPYYRAKIQSYEQSNNFTVNLYRTPIHKF